MVISSGIVHLLKMMIFRLTLGYIYIYIYWGKLLEFNINNQWYIIGILILRLFCD